jgi:hypothetical protein
MFCLGQSRLELCLDGLLVALQSASEGLGHDLAASLYNKFIETIRCCNHDMEMNPWTLTDSYGEQQLDDSFQHQPLKSRQALLDENRSTLKYILAFLVENRSILEDRRQRLHDAVDLLESRLGKLCSTFEVVLRDWDKRQDFAETSQEQSQEASLLSIWKPLGPTINVIEEDWAAISSWSVKPSRASTSLSSKNYEIGVTYSETVIIGISDSIFAVP